MDEETKAFARPQLEEMLAMLGEAEVEMMLAAMVEQAPDNPAGNRLQALGPAGNAPILNALLTGTRVD